MQGWNLDQKKHGLHNRQAKPHEDQDGMAETKSVIILIHLQDEMMPIQAKMQWRSPAQWTYKRSAIAEGKSVAIFKI